MRIVKGYSGKHIAYRAYYKGQMVWDYGQDTQGDLLAALNAVARSQVESPTPIMLHGDATASGAGLADVRELDPVLVHADAELTSKTIPRAAEAVRAACQIDMGIRAIGAVATFGLVFTQGRADAELTAKAIPHTVGSVHAAGAAASLMAGALRPRTDAVWPVLAAARAEMRGELKHESQDTERVLMRSASALTASAGASAVPVHTVTFVYDGEELYKTKIIHGYTCPDPVATREIGTPTKEMTVSHTYEFSGWEVESTESDGADTVILAETERRFSYYSAYGCYGSTDLSPTYGLDAGQEYTVVWDGESYVRTAFAFTAQDGSECVGVGNPLAAGQAANEDMFCVVYDRTNNFVHFFSLSQEEAHTVAIYQGAVNIGEESTTGDPLSCVTQDIVVHPKFTESIRYYNIKLYDGNDVLQDMDLPYGSEIPAYTPTKQGYIFQGWDPEFAPVTRDAIYYSVWDKIPTFAEASWAKIAELSEFGMAKQYFQIGDTKDVEMTDGTVLTFEIVGFDHDNLADGSGKAGISVLSKYVYTGYKALHTSSSRTNWPDCALRTALNSGTIYNKLPTELKSVVKAVNKIYNEAGSRKTNLYTVSDKFWIPSITEIGYTGYQSWWTNEQGTRYSMYTGSSTQSSLDPKLVKTSRTDTSTALTYWLRSPTNASGYPPYYYVRKGSISNSSGAYYADASSSQTINKELGGTVFGFCI